MIGNASGTLLEPLIGVLLAAGLCVAATQAADGQCSLREAILSSNNNVTTDTCGPGTGDDAIFFNLGTGFPQIQINSALPQITAKVSIDGATGGTTRLSGTCAQSGRSWPCRWQNY